MFTHILRSLSTYIYRERVIKSIDLSIARDIMRQALPLIPQGQRAMFALWADRRIREAINAH
jgi:hypothetical protein